ncbi:aromatic amino acid ammonia-lyase [Leifsonia sp. F6_8S_P_1B]|uniref:Aromatic amino acid ammonia-lyase n=1 Tax=Leifsonia williamsii TaxID=3035919 RepID=A0ABT8KEN8_9MICO|nr:aromatic amino acid ammonia-lyase [Leifsonia williamsii]MDN4615915.1 aromatic amino acid ammonia-lyase [Leifsonia williamsii]
MTIRFGAGAPTPADIAAIADGERVELTAEALEALAASRTVVERAIASGEPVYGLNRRLGAGRDDAVDPEEFDAFQRRTIANHRGGIGDPLPVAEARAVVAARLAGFTRGGAGVRPELAEAYAALLNAGITPVIPSRGSVGAADLTVLAEVAAVVTGEGLVIGPDGEELPAAEALATAGLSPLALAPHEALAALSSNAYSIGVGALALRDAAALAEAADRAVALSLEAVAATGPAGNPSPYGEVVTEARGGAGQRASAAAIRAALAGGRVLASSRETTVQDPLAFRTAPQLHGALREAVDRLRAELELELAARSENPVVDVPSGAMVSGGNFQALPLALAFEALRLALAHVASAAERRTAALSLALAPARAAGRTTVPGLLLYTAASDTAELKQLAVPVTLGSTTLSGVEDHASFAAPALRLAQRSLALTRDVLAIEALHAVDLLGTADAGAASPTGAGTGPLAAAIRVSANTRTPAARLVSEVGRLLG